MILIISLCSHQRDNQIIQEKKGRWPMAHSGRERYEPDCPLAHELINKLSVIVGHCDLLVAGVPENSPLFARMLLVRDLAKSVGDEIGQLQCDLARVRAANEQRASKGSVS